MYMEMEKDLIERIERITWTDYDKKENKVRTSAVYGMLEDLVARYEMLEEKFEDYQQNVVDNYRRISVAEQVDWRD